MSDLVRIFRWPMVIAVSTFVGLMAALWGGAAWHWLSWIGLTAPLVLLGAKLAGLSAAKTRRRDAGESSG